MDNTKVTIEDCESDKLVVSLVHHHATTRLLLETIIDDDESEPQLAYDKRGVELLISTLQTFHKGME